MTEFQDEVSVDDIYDGDPDPERPRHFEGIQDDGDGADFPIAAFMAQGQRDTDAALEWYVRNHVDPPFDPDGYCQKICRYARNIAAKYASAKESQDNTPREFRVHKIEDLRRGMVAYFDTVGDSNPFGHIVTIVGRVKGVDRSKLESLIVWTNSVKANELVKVRGNYFRDHWGDEFTFGATWLNGQELKLPAPPAPPPAPVVSSPDFVKLDVMFAPLQYSDTPKQRSSDAEKILARAHARGMELVGGTEAGSAETRAILKAACDKYNYRFFWRGPNDAWIAVRRPFIAGNVEVEFEPIIKPAEGVGHHGHRGVLCVSFDTKNLGRITVLACHYLRFGRPDPASDEYQRNLALNKRLARKVGELTAKHNKGTDKVIYFGDQNIPDRHSDTFFNQPLTSIQDELKKWENTGHGPIDVIASSDADKNVVGLYVRVQDDDEFPLYGDHFVLEAGFNVKPLR